MRKTLSLIAVTWAAMSAGAMAQPAPPVEPDITFISAEQTAALIAKAKAERKDTAMAPVQTMVRAPGLRALVEYRVGPTPASIHEHEAELFYVLEGSGAMIVGGALTDAKRANASNFTGTGVSGGVTYPLSKGDFLLVPAGTPHYYAQVGTQGLTVMSLHIPVAP
ncbi:AraC family ligand binding domain-containing protein [Phenylobacterium sp.]|uniref:cupin domain-containing protein n=1 Tax=Phenylobacterium sp. TaxID=1871053 RepID=UPI0027375731|nr:AraC family ligand binding domain-containing protein [Phenylobacterium sp.]MDP3659647.1 AraC family ligand binding domain-containing protein [Phenylobacterium sp.]